MMGYSKKQFGKELRKQLELDYGVKKLSFWAYGIYLKNCNKFEPGLKDIVMDIVAMAEGIEFEISKDELMTMSQELEANQK